MFYHHFMKVLKMSHLYLHSLSSGILHPFPPQPSLQWHWEENIVHQDCSAAGGDEDDGGAGGCDEDDGGSDATV